MGSIWVGGENNLAGDRGPLRGTTFNGDLVTGTERGRVEKAEWEEGKLGYSEPCLPSPMYIRHNRRRVAVSLTAIDGRGGAALTTPPPPPAPSGTDNKDLTQLSRTGEL